MIRDEWNRAVRLILVSTCFVIIGLTLVGCQSSLQILDGATHACGQIHVEGYFTDTQGEVIVVKAPAEWDADQVKAFCDGA